MSKIELNYKYFLNLLKNFDKLIIIILFKKYIQISI